jgi:Trm5-related predicted tRNA methylase
MEIVQRPELPQRDKSYSKQSMFTSAQLARSVAFALPFLCGRCAGALAFSTVAAPAAPTQALLSADAEHYLLKRQARTHRQAVKAAATVCNRKVKRRERRQQQRAMLGSQWEEHLLQLQGTKQKNEKRLRAALACSTTPRIVVDLSFSDLHSEGALKSLCRQLSAAYGELRRSSKPPALWLTSCDSAAAAQLKVQGGASWIADIKSESIFDCVDARDIVYLSPDASTALTTLQAGKVYVIGGIVDRSGMRSQLYVLMHSLVTVSSQQHVCVII